MVGVPRTVIQLERLSETVLAELKSRFAGTKIVVDGTKITMEVPEPDRQTPDIVEAVVRAGGRIQFAGVTGSTLEDTYLKLVRREA